MWWSLYILHNWCGQLQDASKQVNMRRPHSAEKGNLVARSLIGISPNMESGCCRAELRHRLSSPPKPLLTCRLVEFV